MRGGEYLDAMDDAYELSVTDGDFFGSGEVPPASHGCCLVDARWRLEAGDAAVVESEDAASAAAGKGPWASA
jgi:lipopolysaccharide transport system ATP-binding protein